MAIVRLLLSAKLAALAAMLVGCSESENAIPVMPVAPAAASSPAVAQTTSTAGEPKPPVVPASLADEPASETDKPTTPKPTAAEYTPPFPDRVDLFVPPKRQGGVVLKEGGTEDAVELLGFIRLDKQQVVLSVNGQLTRIAEGDSQYGIEVISIQPPEVVLQRGRQRWQASLEK
ncbi:MAG TPA: hypothetical protein VF175_17875 [Lacipirellula sp.]